MKVSHTDSKRTSGEREGNDSFYLTWDFLQTSDRSQCIKNSTWERCFGSSSILFSSLPLSELSSSWGLKECFLGSFHRSLSAKGSFLPFFFVAFWVWATILLLLKLTFSRLENPQGFSEFLDSLWCPFNKFLLGEKFYQTDPSESSRILTKPGRRIQILEKVCLECGRCCNDQKNLPKEFEKSTSCG